MLNLGEASTAHRTHLPITTNHHLLPSKHHIRGPLQAGGQRETCVGISQAQNQVKAQQSLISASEQPEPNPPVWKHQWGKELDSPIQDGLPAAVQVIKLLLGDRVVHVHGWDTELPSLGELVQPGRGQRQVRAHSSHSLRSLALPSQSSHLCTPVTLSSTIPRIFLNTLGYFL